MTLTLILTRHAKSSWDNPSQDDHDRPLNPRGRTSAKALGAWLRERDHLPDEVIVSGARRTVETWERMAHAMPADTTMRSDPLLYHAAPETMLGVLRRAGRGKVMLVGHNPGIAEFAARLVRSAPDHPRFGDYPTGATTVMTFDGPRWADVAWGSGRVADFIVPRDLTDQ